MLRKWIAPMASLALLAGLSATAVRAADAPTTAPAAGKATISIKVVDADGKAVAGATVDLMPPRVKAPAAAAANGDGASVITVADPATPTTPAPKRARVKPLQTATTEADGTATFKGVADGSYIVRAHLKGTGNGTEKVTIADDKDASVTITLKPRA